MVSCNQSFFPSYVLLYIHTRQEINQKLKPNFYTYEIVAVYFLKLPAKRITLAFLTAEIALYINKKLPCPKALSW